MCCDNGGCFIKVGQHVAALEYLLPPEYVDVMKVLHSDAPQTPVKNLFSVLEEDLGKPVRSPLALHNACTWFNLIGCSSASL